MEGAEKKWFELGQKFPEAVRNLSRANLLRGATSPDRIRELIREHEETGDITHDVAEELRARVDSLANKPKRRK